MPARNTIDMGIASRIRPSSPVKHPESERVEITNRSNRTPLYSIDRREAVTNDAAANTIADPGVSTIKASGGNVERHFIRGADSIHEINGSFSKATEF